MVMVLIPHFFHVKISSMKSAELIKILQENGWQLARVNGSHHIFTHQSRKNAGHVTVPHPKKDLGVGLVHAILKQAGLR